MDYEIPGETFYMFMGSHIAVDPAVSRALRDCDFIFTVGSEDLNTYIEVNEPSMTIIQNKPTFSDIINGIGLFTSRVVEAVDTLCFSDYTIAEIRYQQVHQGSWVSDLLPFFSVFLSFFVRVFPFGTMIDM